MKKHSPLLLTAFGFAFMLAALHWFGTVFYVYWTFVWFDTVAHLLGGFTVALFGLWIWWESGLFGKKMPSKKEAFITALIFGMAAGFGWEVFEYVYNIANPSGGETYLQDTFHDLVNDFIGATIAGIYGARAKFYSGMK